MSFDERVKQEQEEIEQIIRKFLPKNPTYQKTVVEAMDYSIQAGGKRLRPMLMRETYRLLGGTGRVIEPFMAAQEMIHTYSLVHDDLPAMDNDRFRRGKETTWVRYGDGMAVLAGDALLNYAFETALCAFDEDHPDFVPKAVRVLAGKAGVYGMLGGQVADVEAEEKELQMTQERLVFIHQNKTAALLESSMMIGAILAGGNDTEIAIVEKAARLLGIAFQIQDDILDIEGNEKELGKPVGSDKRNKKETYVDFCGMEKAKNDVREMSLQAMELINSLPGKNEFLSDLMKSLINRKK